VSTARPPFAIAALAAIAVAFFALPLAGLVYRVSWQTTLGGSPQGIVYPNMKKWSGDHGGYDYATTAGVLISNRPVKTDTPSIVDIAPTVLRFFGVQIPREIDGKSILQ